MILHYEKKTIHILRVAHRRSDAWRLLKRKAGETEIEREKDDRRKLIKFSYRGSRQRRCYARGRADDLIYPESNSGKRMYQYTKWPLESNVKILQDSKSVSRDSVIRRPSIFQVNTGYIYICRKHEKKKLCVYWWLETIFLA